MEDARFSAALYVASLVLGLAVGAFLAGLRVRKLVPEESFDALRSHFKVAV